MSDRSTIYVLDASVCIKHFVPDALSNKVDSFLSNCASGATHISVPDLFYIEMTNIFWKYFRARQFDKETVLSNITTLKAFNFNITSNLELIEKAAQIAMLYQISAYDASYVVLAQKTNSPLLTLDNKLIKALSSSTFNIVSFSNFNV